METVVDRLYSDFRELVNHLDAARQISLRSAAEENFRKSILLAAASYFEHSLNQDILAFVNEASYQNRILLSFVKNKALSRQFHSLFDWDSSNANKFFALFGEEFKSFMNVELQRNDPLASSVKAFLEIGRERNRLVHQDFGSYSLEKTAEEIYELYRNALDFVQVVVAKMRQCVEDAKPHDHP